MNTKTTDSKFDKFSSSGTTWQSHAVDYANDHHFIRDAAADALNAPEPVAFQPEHLGEGLLKRAKRGRAVPLADTLIRSWCVHHRVQMGPCEVGIQLFEIDGIKFAHARFHYNHDLHSTALEFFVVDRPDYLKLYRAALACDRELNPYTEPPVMHAAFREQLWRNSIGFLTKSNIATIKRYGGRPRRGLILSGAPGNGKTMACRWLWSECRKLNLEWKIVTPDDYRAARSRQAIPELFSLSKRGIIFFDDMDVAMRDRERFTETDDQSVFLSAIDGIQVVEGIVFVFTTNCAVDLIDKAFKRPGRIDVILEMKQPDAKLREAFLLSWDKDLVESIVMREALKVTDGFSFAELAEVRNLMVMYFVDTGRWEFHQAIRQFKANRDEFNKEIGGRVGFSLDRNHGLQEAVPVDPY